MNIEEHTCTKTTLTRLTWSTIHNTVSNICCVRGKTCCVGGLPYITHFQIYIVLEVKHVALSLIDHRRFPLLLHRKQNYCMVLLIIRSYHCIGLAQGIIALPVSLVW